MASLAFCVAYNEFVNMFDCVVTVMAKVSFSDRYSLQLMRPISL